MAAEIGKPAPDFSLPDVNRDPVTLDSLRGRKALVTFVPFPFTGVCTGEVCDLQNNLSRLRELDAGAVVITCDTPFSNGKWAELEGLEFPILSDFWPHGATASAYGCFNEQLGIADRATYVLDADGVVTDIFTTDHILTPRNLEDQITALG